MTVQRYDLNKCIGWRNCLDACTMDVFRFNEDYNKSVIAYRQNWGQCYVNCLGHSLAMSGESHSYPLASIRAASSWVMNRELMVSDNPKSGLVLPVVAGLLGAMFTHKAILWGRKAEESL